MCRSLGGVGVGAEERLELADQEGWGGLEWETGLCVKEIATQKFFLEGTISATW